MESAAPETPEPRRSPWTARTIGRVAAVHRADPILFWSFAVLSIAVVWPFWVSDFLPFLDIPQHLATIAVMHFIDDPKLAYASYFTIEAGSTQYLLYYLTCDLLSTITGVETANRIFLSLYALLLPLGLLYFLHAFGRLRAAALLAFPLVFNTFLFYGFVNYVFAFPFFFFGLGLHKRALDSERERWVTQGLLVACGLLVFYSHLQVFLVYIGGVGLITLTGWPGAKRFVTRQLHVLPALLLFCWWNVATDGMAGGEAWEETVSKRYESIEGAKWEKTLDSLRGMPDRLMNVYHSQTDDRIMVAWGLLVLLLLMLRRTGEPPEPSRRARVAGWAPELLTLCVLIFYFVVPTSYDWIWPVNWRFLPLAALLLLSWARADLGRWSGGILTLVLACFAFWVTTVHTRHFREFDEEAQSVLPVLEKIAPRARVATLIFDSSSKVVTLPSYLHFGQYHQLWRGGVATYSFAEAPQSPIRFHPHRRGGPPPTILRSEWKPHLFRFTNDNRFYDYFLVRGERRGFFRRAGFTRKEVAQVAKNGPWTLYQFKRSR